MFFIREYFIKDPSICDLLFDVTKGLKEKGYGQPGTAWSPDAPEDYDMTEAKDSWDILPADFAEMYPKGPSSLGMDKLANELNQEIFPKYYQDIDLNFRGELFCMNPPQFQLYEPGGGYKKWHADATGKYTHRMFVYILYLNDVPDGGTEFRDWNYTCKAERGKVVIFPANFTHVHRGQISHTSEKTIMTGWIDTDIVELLRME
jgi:hypothetical protein